MLAHLTLMTTPSAVDPTKLPKTMSWGQLEYWILFTIAVAGKNAKVTEQKMKEFLNPDHLAHEHNLSPFEIVRYYVRRGRLASRLKEVKLGKYNLLERGYQQVLDIDLRQLKKDAPQDALATLEDIVGIGPKGARMILMYAFPHHADLWVPLDTHILKFLRKCGHDAPLATPTGKTYLRLEEDFRHEAKKLGMTMRELDTKVWLEYSGYKETV